MAERTQLSREQRHRDVLDALGNSVRTAREIADVLEGIEGWEMTGWATKLSLYQLAYTTLERLRLMGEVAREPTGRGRPKWLYMKPIRPLHGPIVELERQFSVADPEQGVSDA